MKYVLHLGLPKTATTSLQKNVFPRLPGFALSLRETSGPAAILQGVRYKAVDAAHLPQGEAGYLAKLQKRFHSLAPSEADIHTVLVSNENIIGPHPDGPAALIQRIKTVCVDARVFIVLREPMDFLQSIFRQELTNYVSELAAGGKTFTAIKRFDSFAASILDAGVNGHLAYLHHNEIVGTLYSLFGRPNVLVLDFKMLKSAEAGFLREILHFIGGPVSLAATLGHENVTASKLESILAVAAANGVTVKHQKEIANAYEDTELSASVSHRLQSYFAQHTATTNTNVNRPS